MLKQMTVLAAGLLFAGVSAADGFQPQAYGAVGLGLSHARYLEKSVSGFQEDAIRLGLSTSSDIEDTAPALKMLAGYRFHRSFALEAQYAYLGKFTADIRGMNNAVDAGEDAKAYGFGVAGLAFVPIAKDTELFVKAGVFRSRFNASAHASGLGIYNYEDSMSATSTKPWYGVGLTFQRSATSRVRVEYEYYADVGKSGNFAGTKVDALTVSGQLDF